MAPAAIVVIVNAGSGGGNDQALVNRLAGHFQTAGLHAENYRRPVSGKQAKFRISD